MSRAMGVREHLCMSVLITLMITLTFTRPSSDKHTYFLPNCGVHTISFTFEAADPPETRVGECPWVFLVLVVGVLLGRVSRAVAYEGTGVQPVVCTDGHRHQGEGRKRPHGGQQHLDAPLTPHQCWTGKETNI